MSTATDKFLGFAEKVTQSTALQQQLKAIKPGDSAAVVALANSQGYNFSIEDLQEAVRETSIQANGENDELLDDQLDRVSGGLVVNAQIVILLAMLVPAVQKTK